MRKILLSTILAGSLVLPQAALSEKIDINFPQLSALIGAPPVQFSVENGVPAIYISNTIQGINEYQQVIMYINSLQHVPRVKLYLNGYGGSVVGVIALINTIQASPSKFDVIVYGDVYSAHALLALAGDTLTIDNPNTLFLFHTAAVSNSNGDTLPLKEACVALKGKSDRGHDAELKCRIYMTAIDKQFNSYLSNLVYPYLTKQEIRLINNGFDLTITGEVMSRRINHSKHQ